MAFSYSEGEDEAESEAACASGNGALIEAPEAFLEDNDVSLTCADAFVPKGSFVVAEGPSGSGKSTLFKLALGAYDAEGFTYELAYDGNTASCAASQVPPGVFAYVPQDNFLFAGTVRENIFRSLRRDRRQIERPAKRHARGAFERAFLGLDTMIGEHGQGLSRASCNAWPSRARYVPARPLWCSTRSQARSTTRPKQRCLPILPLFPTRRFCCCASRESSQIRNHASSRRKWRDERGSLGASLPKNR